jgi:predicted NBD/HSP70 family sugar kinase
MPANQRSGQYNINRLLRELWHNRGLSRIQLAQRLNLDKSTVTHMVSRMEKKGIVSTLSEGSSSSKGGRKPLSLGINGSYAYFLGIEIQPEALVLTLINLEGIIVKNEITPINFKGNNFHKLFGKTLIEIYNNYSTNFPLMAIGLGISGIVNPHEGRIMKSMLLQLREGCLLEDLFTTPFPCPIIIDNDANCCTWGELVNKEENESILFLLLETDMFRNINQQCGRFSLGMGISLHDRVYRGKQFSAGEFLSPQWSGDRRSQFSLTKEELKEIGNEKKIRLKLFKEIGENVAFLTNSLDLDRIIVGGDIEPFWEELEPILTNAIGNNQSYPNNNSCSCSLSQKGIYAVSYGAAIMPLIQIFSLEPDDKMNYSLHGKEALEEFSNRIG